MRNQETGHTRPRDAHGRGLMDATLTFAPTSLLRSWWPKARRYIEDDLWAESAPPAADGAPGPAGKCSNQRPNAALEALHEDRLPAHRHQPSLKSSQSALLQAMDHSKNARNRDRRTMAASSGSRPPPSSSAPRYASADRSLKETAQFHPGGGKPGNAAAGWEGHRGKT